MLTWNLPIRSQKDIRTEGMFTALNECSLRTVNRFELTVIIDFDEFILPRKELTLQDMIRRVDKDPRTWVSAESKG